MTSWKTTVTQNLESITNQCPDNFTAQSKPVYCVVILTFLFSQSDGITLLTNTPDFTLCMQHTLLTWIPAAYLLLSSACLAVWYSGKPTVYRWSDKSKLNVAKLVRVY